MLFVFLAAASSAVWCQAQPPIKHFVVVMFENRAFDHMLGHLKLTNPAVNGLFGNETVPIDPMNISSATVRVSFDALDQMPINPAHSVEGSYTEMFGRPFGSTIVDPAPMNGFIADSMNRGNTLANARTVMQCFNATSVPTLSYLARNYALFDSWFSSVPGPTYVNRLFAWTGTSDGFAENSAEQSLKGFDQTSIFQQLLDAGLDYRIYFGDVPSAIILDDVRFHPTKLSLHSSFEKDAASGNLPTFSWIDPRYFSIGPLHESDQHPGNPSATSDDSVKNGDDLLARIYTTLRKSPAWNDTALLIYYDEHGGLFDHQSPPMRAPNPDGKNSTSPAFKFDRLGVRVPAIVVSPRVRLGSIVRPQNGRYFEHTSMIATVRKLFPALTQKPLTKREAWAAHFANIFDQQPCGNACPPPIRLQRAKHARDDGSLETLLSLSAKFPSAAAQRPLTDLQLELLGIVAKLTEQPSTETSHEFALAQESNAAAALFIRKRLNHLINDSRMKK